MIQEDLLTASEACAKLRISYSTLRRWIAEGKIRCFHVGARIRIPVSEVAGAVVDRSAPGRAEGAA